jgi:hypothetical protein
MTTSPHSLQQRYEAIERVYSKRQWDDVARLSEELLLELPNEPADPLRQRLQLLLAHTYLYGYQDRAIATGFYSRVRAATQEPVLRDIADQGLEQCSSQPAPPAPTLEVGSGQTPIATSTSSAMPWLEQLGDIEVVQESLAEPVGEPSPEELAELSKGLLRVVIRSASHSG